MRIRDILSLGISLTVTRGTPCVFQLYCVLPEDLTLWAHPEISGIGGGNVIVKNKDLNPHPLNPVSYSVVDVHESNLYWDPAIAIGFDDGDLFQGHGQLLLQVAPSRWIRYQSGQFKPCAGLTAHKENGAQTAFHGSGQAADLCRIGKKKKKKKCWLFLTVLIQWNVSNSGW